MLLESLTLLVSTIVALLFLGCSLVYFWNRDRRSSWLLWWAVTFLITGAAAAAYLRPNWEAGLLSIGLGNAVRMAAVGLLWQGARVFERRRPMVLPILLVPVVWFGLCTIPAFVGSMPARIIGVSLAMAAFCSLAAFELWRGRAERLASRMPAIAVLLSFAAVMALRIAMVNVLPFPMGALPLDPNRMAAFNLIVFVHCSFLGLLIIALTKERLELEQRNIALIDPLTGLMNRRAFMSQVERNARRRKSGRESTSLMVLDLDHFKSVNDRFGHDVGDKVLVSFAKAAEANVRVTDQLYRLGGEEFCCILPDTDLQEAVSTAERIRRECAEIIVDVGGGQIAPASVSIGVATAEHAGFDLDVLLAAADAALYEAKMSGRNRVAVAGSITICRLAADKEVEARRRSA